MIEEETYVKSLQNNMASRVERQRKENRVIKIG